MEAVIKEEVAVEEDIQTPSENVAGEEKIKSEPSITTDVNDNIEKTERVKTALASYLKRRNFRVMEKRNGEVELVKTMCVDANEAKKLAIVRAAAMNPNVVSYSPATIDTLTLKHVDQQFTKLIEYISNIKKDKIKRELLFIMPIMLAHLYLEVLQGVTRKSALLFLRRQSIAIGEIKVPGTEFPKNYFQLQGNTGIIDTFRENSSFNEWLTEVVLELTGCRDEVDSHSMPILMLFRSMKQKVNISKESSSFLTTYLSKHAHILILHVLNRWFKYEITTDLQHMNNRVKLLSNMEETESDDEGSSEKSSKSASQCEVVPKSSQSPIPDSIKLNGLPKDKILPTPTTSTIVKSNGLDPDNSEHNELLVLKENINRMKNINKTIVTNLLNADELSCVLAHKNSLTKAAGFTTSDILICNNFGEEQVDMDFEALHEEEQIGFSWIKYDELPILAHTKGITALRFTKTDPYILSSSRDTTIKLWKLSTGCHVATYDGHHKPVWCLDISPNDYYFASGSQDCTARLWAFDRKNVIRTFAGHISDIECIQFHSNERYVATGSKDTTVRIFSIFDGSPTRLLNGKGGSISVIAFSPNGKMLAAAGEDTHIQIWDIGMCKRVSLLSGHTSHVVSLAWDPSSGQDRLISGSYNGEIKIWSYESGNQWSVTSPYRRTFQKILNVEYLQKGKDWTPHVFAIPERCLYS